MIDLQPEEEAFEYAMKMILLCASYPYVWNSSEYIRKVVEIVNESFDVTQLRNIDNYYYKVRKGDRGEYFIDFYDKNKNELICII